MKSILKDTAAANLVSTSFSLENPDVRNSLMDSEVSPFCSSADYSKFKDLISEQTNPISDLLDLLKKFNLHFGYRVVNEISRFIWLSKDLTGENFDLNATMDIQILQKILPKFHGTRGKLEEPLKELLTFCKGGEASQEEMSNQAAQSQGGGLYPRSARKIARMINNLNDPGIHQFHRMIWTSYYIQQHE